MKNKKNLTIILIALATADLLGSIDNSSLSVALPKITADLGSSISVSQWISLAYVLTLVSTLIFFGRIGDIVGPKKTYLYGLGIFGLTSLLLSFINQPHAIIGLRAVQGLGTAILYTIPISIIAHLWEKKEEAFAVTTSFLGLGLIIGPVIGGMLSGINVLGIHGWHLIFLINVPIVIFALIASNKYIPVISPMERKPFSWISLMIFFSFLLITTLSISNISKYFFILSALLLALFLYLEKGKKDKLIEFDLFKIKDFLYANISSFLSMMIFIGLTFFLTFYLENKVGWSTSQTGFAILPVPVATIIFATIAGRIRNQRNVLWVSSILIVFALSLLLAIGEPNNYFPWLFSAITILGAASGLFMTSVFSLIMSSAHLTHSGQASGLLNTIQQMGSLIAIAMITPVIYNYNKVYLGLLAIAIASLFFALIIRREKLSYE